MNGPAPDTEGVTSMQEQRSSETDVAWAAGLFEGEGCFPRGKWGAAMNLTSTDLDVLERFKDAVGCGAVVGPHHATGGLKPAWRWQAAQAAEVARVIALFLPWLGERRRERALQVLERAEATRPYGRAHCPSGHVMEGDNLVFEALPEGRRTRRCRECRRAQNSRSYRRRRAKRLTT